MVRSWWSDDGFTKPRGYAGMVQWRYPPETHPLGRFSSTQRGKGTLLTMSKMGARDGGKQVFDATSRRKPLLPHRKMLRVAKEHSLLATSPCLEHVLVQD